MWMSKKDLKMRDNAALIDGASKPILDVLKKKGELLDKYPRPTDDYLKEVTAYLDSIRKEYKENKCKSNNYSKRIKKALAESDSFEKEEEKKLKPYLDLVIAYSAAGLWFMFVTLVNLLLGKYGLNFAPTDRPGLVIVVFLFALPVLIFNIVTIISCNKSMKMLNVLTEKEQMEYEDLLARSNYLWIAEVIVTEWKTGAEYANLCYNIAKE